LVVSLEAVAAVPPEPFDFLLLHAAVTTTSASSNASALRAGDVRDGAGFSTVPPDCLS
jgi:hypothetical protein